MSRLSVADLRQLPLLSLVLRGEVVFAKYQPNAWYQPGLVAPVTTAELVERADILGEDLRFLWMPDLSLERAMDEAFGEPEAAVQRVRQGPQS